MSRKGDLGARVLPPLDVATKFIAASESTRSRLAHRYASMDDAMLARTCRELAVERGEVWRESPSLTALLNECARRLGK